MTAVIGAKMASVTTDEPETPGQELARCMDELGVTKTQLSEASGKSRGTINKALADDDRVRHSTYSDLMRVLNEVQADREDGPVGWVASDEADLVRIEMRGVFGVEAVTFSGPTDDLDAVRQAAVDFVKQLRDGTDTTTSAPD